MDAEADSRATRFVLKDRGRALRRSPAVAPRGERHDDGFEVDSLPCDHVFGVFESRTSRLHDACSNERLQASGENVRRDTEASLKVREPRQSPEQRIANDQEAPALAHDLERPGRRTVLPFIEAPEHNYMLLP